MTRKPEDLVKGVIKLISLPEIFIRVNQVMEDPNHNAKQLGDVISHDPSLTARILRIVNSSYYALVVKIEIVSRAISIIGEDDLRNLVLATSAVDSFKRIPNELVDIDLFWRHSVHTGIIARLISKQCNILHGERLFVAGLLHDIGKLILYFEEPDLSQKVLLRAAESDGVTYRAEKEIIGFTHADVGAALIKAWQLSDTLNDTISFHHEPLLAKKHPLETAIVHIANCIVNALEPGMEVDEYLLDDYPEFEPETLKITGFKLNKLPQIMDKAWEQAAEVLDIICPKI
ncbi:MAG: HDOD domain-containing protein [Gammaproteobacteria bacterium]|nr:HDOD domain-containing protein [Gammaproteobacteria bacterium]MDH5735893.1 HDOD domain-containing protein [Gammaproteobacteria bacterium]